MITVYEYANLDPLFSDCPCLQTLGRLSFGMSSGSKTSFFTRLHNIMTINGNIRNVILNNH